jgi:hypothetical protein
MSLAMIMNFLINFVCMSVLVRKAEALAKQQDLKSAYVYFVKPIQEVVLRQVMLLVRGIYLENM